MKELRVMCHLGAEVIWLANLADDGRDILFQYTSAALARNIQLSPLRLPLRATRSLTRDVREVKKALRYCVFNLLMNNRDDHAKNLAFLLDDSGNWQLAPPYDLTWCPGYRGEHFMDVAGEGKQPGRSHVLKVAQEAGLSAKEAGQIIDQMLDQISPAEIKSSASTLPIRKATLLEVTRGIALNRKRLLEIP